ncbi:putative ion transporter [Scheffersomyces coipomensis]|uniref:putative ion transporter n=1 Tax=Scheffersomyces coipomensis TaxID=1788519 RepID=UPI00315DA94A
MANPSKNKSLLRGDKSSSSYNENAKLLPSTHKKKQPSSKLNPNQSGRLVTTDRRKSISKLKAKKANPANVSAKLGTFEGVFLPTALNVLSILMFLRFGFIIGQMGIIGTFFLLILSYSINILTTMSISAISTNGTVRGGGAYYMISRSLGPEFGGAIGIIFFIGQILNSSLNVVGFIEPLMVNFGEFDGSITKILPEGYFWQVLYSTILLAICTGVALVGSQLVSKTAFFLFITLTISTLSIPVSTLFVKPFYPLPPPYDDILYSGLHYKTFFENLWPHFTSGAAGSVQPPNVPETFRNLFGIFFPATAGILAGASMSGDLKSPSKSIPEGTIKGLFITFILYSSVIISMGAAIPRDLLHVDIKIIQTVNLSGVIVLLGEFSTSLFSVIMGIVGAASMLNAIADDKIIPGLSLFTTLKKTPKQQDVAKVLSIIATWSIAQVFLFADINQIATFITMAFLMTFIVTNMACFLLKVGSAPNFRPSFKYFSSRTAFTGVLACFFAMFIVDGLSATLVIFCLMFLILMIHYSTPPSKFGDISQLLIYHQVRKYLLRLKLQMNVKYWRPQILLLSDDPRSGWNLIGFCNHLKKGGLYILGHVVIMNDDTTVGGNDSEKFNIKTYKEVEKQRQAWLKLRDMAKIKAFVQIALGPTLPWGVRNVYLGSGLGGMKPNITVLGFYEAEKHGFELPAIKSFNDTTNYNELPTDDCRKEQKVSIKQWVQIVEDLIILQATVAVGANFSELTIPKIDHAYHFFWSKPKPKEKSSKKYIDLYPIQMSSINTSEDGRSILSTNFDTYTLILQLGSILSTVPEWKFSLYTLRVIAFVETTGEAVDELKRVQELLANLRIDAELKVVCLDQGNLNTYNFLVKGYNKTATNKDDFDRLDRVLAHDQWWKNLCDARETLKELDKQKMIRKHKHHLTKSVSSSKSSLLIPDKTFSPLNLTSTSPPVSTSFQKNRRYTLSNLHEQGLSLSFNVKNQNGGNKYFDSDAFESSESSDSDKEDDLESDSNDSASRTPTYGSTANSTPSPLSVAARKPPKPNQLDQFYLPSGVKSVDQLSIKSSISNLRPNFSSVKIPQSQIKDDGDDDGDDENESTIKFVDDDDDDDADADAEEGEDIVVGGNGSKVSTNGDPEEKSEKPNDYFNYKPVEMIKGNSSKKSNNGMHSPSLIANTDDIIKVMRTPQFLAQGDSDDDIDDIPSINDSALNAIKPQAISSGPTNSRSEFYKNKSKLSYAATNSNDEATVTQKQLQEELKNLSFNDLPAKGQHLILNELMKVYSPKEDTAVIFSTLPAPSIGTHLDENDSMDYTNNLAIWLHDLPPILLLNSQTVTVTTAL